MPFIVSASLENKSRFVALTASNHGRRQINLLTNEAQRHLPALAHRATRAAELHAAVARAEKDADATVEILLSGLPAQITPIDLVRAVQLFIYRSAFVARNYSSLGNRAAAELIGSAVLKCEFFSREQTHESSLRDAHLLLRDWAFAGALLEESPVDILGYPVVITETLTSFSRTARTRRRTPLDPRRKSWRLGHAQVGERLAHDIFSCLWSSSPQYDLSEGTCVELRPIERCFTVVTGREHTMYKTGATLLEFQRVSTRLRFDIPFHFLSADPRIEEDGDFFAVHLPLSKPPFIFRAEASTQKKISTFKWTLNDGIADNFRWTRTVDPTSNNAFSRATGIRLLFHPEEIYRFFKDIYRLCLVSLARPLPVTIRVVEELVTPNPTSIYRRAVEHCGVSFAVRYAAERVLSQHRLPLSFITPNFWLKLSTELNDEDAMVVLECMSFRLSSIDPWAMHINLEVMLDECMALCNIGREKTAHRRLFGKDPVVQDKIISQNYEDGTERKHVKGLGLEQANKESIDKEDRQEQRPFVLADDTLRLSKVRRPSNQRTFIRRLLYTPTRTIALKPESDLMNRVIREFVIHKDRFLRLTFCDDDFNSIAFTGSDDLLARVRQALRDGVLCAGEEFVFLAFSTSQLRENAVWMYNETPSLNERVTSPTADEIRAWMGDFSKIRIPAKFAARQGQAFSSTVGAVILDAVQETEIRDVFDKKGNYAFSDGVGLMSSDLARKVCTNLELRLSSRLPSAFQVRYGGAKGILTVWDAAMPADGNAEIALRPSMKKFGCKHRVLEIVGVARRLPLFLNRQIIMILSGLGVPDEPFEDMQRTLLESLDRAMQSTGATDALNLLFSSGFCDFNIKISKSTSPSMNPGAFFRAGLTCESCEHLYNMMWAFRRRTINDVMGRARIPVDWSKGVSAVGVMDELGVLKPGQVFCQFTKPSCKKVGIIMGMVTVGRYPCHHPGDIQPLLAVDVPELHSLVDVIVFPRTGWRPVTSMLSGGDLDGDIYFCIFDERIAFPPYGPYPPMSYESPNPVELERDVTIADVADFFVDYIQNDKLGQIASAHMLHGDREQEGIFSKICLELAETHSVAVDFAKTGIPPLFPADHQRQGRSLLYPDFMGKPDRISYPSTKILGRLYRACKSSHGLFDGRESFRPNSSSKSVDDILERIGTNSEKYLQEAEVLCDAYNVELIRLMEMYGVQNEGEMMSGQIVAFYANEAQLRARREYASLLARLNHETNELQRQFREIFFRDLDQREDDQYSTDTISKACAWHIACRKKAEADRQAGNVALVSFPWVAADILLSVLSDALPL